MINCPACEKEVGPPKNPKWWTVCQECKILAGCDNVSEELEITLETRFWMITDWLKNSYFFVGPSQEDVFQQARRILKLKAFQ